MRFLLASCLVVVICLGSFGKSANAQQNFSATQAILSSGLHLFAPVSINGTKRTWWLIDTGAPGSLVAPSLQQKLSLPAPPGQTGSPATVKISGKSYPPCSGPKRRLGRSTNWAWLFGCCSARCDRKRKQQ